VCIDVDGKINLHAYVKGNRGVRPAMWIDISKTPDELDFDSSDFNFDF